MTGKICAAPDCGKPVAALGWCGKHYMRLRRSGNALCAPKKAPNGDLERHFREVVMTYEGDDCLIWPYSHNGSGYGMLHYAGRRVYVHRLVCEHVNGPAPAPDFEAAHSCGKGHLGCCNKRHLSWKTRTENHADKVGHGTVLLGEKHSNSKLTEADICQIRSLRGQMSHGDIAKMFGVSRSNITMILSGFTWSWLGAAE